MAWGADFLEDWRSNVARSMLHHCQKTCFKHRSQTEEGILRRDMKLCRFNFVHFYRFNQGTGPNGTPGPRGGSLPVTKVRQGNSKDLARFLVELHWKDKEPVPSALHVARQVGDIGALLRRFARPCARRSGLSRRRWSSWRSSSCGRPNTRSSSSE